MGRGRGDARCFVVPQEQLNFLETEGVPQGLLYQSEWLPPEREAALVDRLAALEFRPFEFQGFVGKRRTVSVCKTVSARGGGRQPRVCE